MKTSLLFLFAGIAVSNTISSQTTSRTPLTERVNIQMDSAKVHQVIDGSWVAVGTNKTHAIQHDYSIPFNGNPSYRFELRQDDNTLEGYAVGETKGRAELSYCYAVSNDFSDKPQNTYPNAQKMKTIYHYGKGIAEQGSSKDYQFSIYVPSELDSTVSTIFAQWHGMPDRTLASTPDGEIRKLTVDEFLDLYETTLFKKNMGHEKIMVTDKAGNPKRDKNGEILYKAGKPNGWLIEQGGYPPLAFGFSGGFFYIKANSDRKWLTDKTDRCNASAEKAKVMQPVTSEYKASTIAYKMPFADFPKDTWVSFDIHIDWTTYGGKSETILKPGKLDVAMHFTKDGKTLTEKIVDNEEILIGRNDDDGYYFKFGIYRVGNSTIPVVYNLAGYSEQ